MASEKCFFGCSKKDDVIEIGQARILSIIKNSRLRGDSYHSDLEAKIQENPEYTSSAIKLVWAHIIPVTI